MAKQYDTSHFVGEIWAKEGERGKFFLAWHLSPGFKPNPSGLEANPSGFLGDIKVDRQKYG
jgi:hypothetical protein